MDIEEQYNSLEVVKTYLKEIQDDDETEDM